MDLLDQVWRESGLSYFSDLKAEKNRNRVLLLLVRMSNFPMNQWKEAVTYICELPESPKFQNEEEAKEYCHCLWQKANSDNAVRDGPQKAGFGFRKSLRGD